ncbi:hypothetical protein ACSMXN_01835 [Jatrophihabitans sp. DSM 45814]
MRGLSAGRRKASHDHVLLADRNPVAQVAAEVLWSFTPPWTWLFGVAINLVLSVLWLIWFPLTGHSHGDWVIVVGTYFAIFVLADVTTTNVLGADAARVRLNLARGVAIGRMLLTKNFALLVIVGVPTLAATAALTIYSETPYRLVLTLPGVALPILAWLGVGNVVSVLLPVATKPMLQRWRERHEVLPTLRWLVHLGLPYALLYLVDPVGDVPSTIFRDFPRHDRTPELRGFLLALTGILIWVAGTVLAAQLVRRRGLRMR